jgi:DNA-binding MarR family transcriptional regulator
MASSKRAGIRVSEDFVAAHPEADPAATELVLNVLNAGQLMMNRLEEVLRPFGLSSSTFTLLQIVAGDPDPVSPSQIASRAPVPVTTATVTGLIDTCEKRGWVQRRRHPTDRRMVIVDITDAGTDLLARVLPVVIEGEHRWTATTAPAARQRLTNALGELADHLRSPAAAPD